MVNGFGKYYWKDSDNFIGNFSFGNRYGYGILKRSKKK